MLCLTKYTVICYISYDERGDIFMNKQSLIKLLLICVFAAAIYLMDMYVMLAPTERTSLQGDGSGVVIGLNMDRSE